MNTHSGVVQRVWVRSSAGDLTLTDEMSCAILDVATASAGTGTGATNAVSAGAGAGSGSGSGNVLLVVSSPSMLPRVCILPFTSTTGPGQGLAQTSSTTTTSNSNSNIDTSAEVVFASSVLSCPSDLCPSLVATARKKIKSPASNNNMISSTGAAITNPNHEIDNTALSPSTSPSSPPSSSPSSSSSVEGKTSSSGSNPSDNQYETTRAKFTSLPLPSLPFSGAALKVRAS